MIRVCSAVLALATTSVVTAQYEISLGVRETGAAGGSFSMVGGDGGFSGGIEWVNLDGQVYTPNGQWQLFTFDLANDPITAFAGGSANGMLDGFYGTIEHIRIRNMGGNTNPITLWIDDVTNIVDAPGIGGTFNFGDFEGYTAGDEVIFQEPGFSGSTSSNLMPGGTSGVDNSVAHTGSGSCRVDFQFVDGMATRWVRLTTFQAANQPNPLIRFAPRPQGSRVSFWIKDDSAPPECFLLLGTDPINGQNGFELFPGDRIYVAPFASIAMSLTNLPSLPLPPDPNMNGLTIYTQGLLYNTFHYPRDPLQLTNAVRFVIGTSTDAYGQQTRFQLYSTSNPILRPGESLSVGFTLP